MWMPAPIRASNLFENAGGALTLKSVVETSALPRCQTTGRDNPAGQALQRLIEEAKQDMRLFFNAPRAPFWWAKAAPN